MDSTPTPSTLEPAMPIMPIMTRLRSDPTIGAALRADLRAASHRAAFHWPVHEEVGADMVGELIGTRHRIVRRLAKGGMADVFLAKDQSRKCPVAIKILRSCSPEARRRFGVEGVVLSNLQHPGIVRAVDVGETPDGRPYIALEYLDGEPLSAYVARGPMPWRDAATFGIQVAGAVHALHTAGLVHRDLKPANVMLTTDTGGLSAAKVIDLGLCRVGAPFLDVLDARFTPDPPERHQTQLGYAIGTPAYLPPEAGHCPAEPRLDVYSLGVTLYQLCTQLLPQDTGGRPLCEVCPGSDAPDDLSRLLQAALASDLDERLASADHLRRGLEAILAAHPRARGGRHLFGGSYDRLEVLGVGASAVVFRGSDRGLSRDVAIKILRDAEPSEDDAIRFRRAAKVLSALRHANIPRILHFGIHDEQAFAVTELCPGSPATGFVRPDNHLRPDEVMTVGQQLAGALAAVHALGVVYRDLHPGNVLIDRGDSTRGWIFDFDQAQVSAEFYAALTERWATPPEERLEPKHEKPLQRMDYAAPEVRGGGVFSPASDVYALGLLLYRLLTGRRPFPASGGETTPPRKVCPACPRGLEGLLLAMLSPSPDTRPALGMIQATLEDEQAELAAEDAEHEDRDEAADNGGRSATSEATADRAVAPDTVPAKPLAAVVRATDGAAAATADTVPASSGRRDTADWTPGMRPRWAPSWWALGLTAAACLALGRMTVSRDQPAPRTPPLPASLTDEERPEALAGDRDRVAGDAVAQLRAALGVAVRVAAVHMPLTLADTLLLVGNDASPAQQIDPDAKRDAASRAVRREAVTQAEALEAAQSAVPGLRKCTDVPRHVTADLDIVRGGGLITALNLRTPDLDDPTSWHACVARSLKPVRFPFSETAGHVQVRLTLR